MYPHAGRTGVQIPYILFAPCGFLTCQWLGRLYRPKFNFISVGFLRARLASKVAAIIRHLDAFLEDEELRIIFDV